MRTHRLLGGGKFEYLTPEVDILSVAIEKGFAQSPEEWADYGKAGDDPEENDYGSF